MFINGAAIPFDFEKYLEAKRSTIESALEALLQAGDRVHPVLREAMRYSLLAPGKRFRAILVIAAGEACGAVADDLMALACAVEFIHAYSLVHDDLPAMDNAELRRGVPTNHRKYGEAMAILAGDALLTEAWKYIVDWAQLKPGRAETGIKIVSELVAGSGIKGMVSGQAFDIDDNRPKNVAELDALHGLKTGALIRASIRIGAHAAGAPDGLLRKATAYADNIGLAFQVADDILDVEGGDIGKDKGADAVMGKRSYPIMVGLENARAKAESLIENAIKELSGFPGSTEPLAAIARYAIDRKR